MLAVSCCRSWRCSRLTMGRAWSMRRRSCVETSSVVRAASEMNTWELEQAIAALGAPERELLIAGDVEAARQIAADKMVCLSVRGAA
ncbi:hypothetical protein GS416_05490 [Rhodococcus hoagii]|nr:hypothetical protein [Prescottella equi]